MRFRTLALGLALASTAAAQTTPPAGTQERARTLFQAGLSHAEQGDLVAALDEFEAAYRVQPHYSVLYNIAQARATLGRPVEAVAAFQRYLSDGGKQISEARRTEVQGLIATNQEHIGQLKVIEPGGQKLRIWLDGVELTAAQKGQAIQVVRGDHTLLYSTELGPARSQAVSVLGKGVVEVPLKAPPTPAAVAAAGGNAALAQLAITCNVPGVMVQVDGIERGTTPLQAPLLLPAGGRSVEFSRTGYAPMKRDVQLEAQGFETLGCALKPLGELAPGTSATLQVSTEPRTARVLLDGQELPATPIPFGEHQLRVEHDGFVPKELSVAVHAGQTDVMSVALEPTPGALAEAQQRRRSRNLTGFVLGGVGLAAAGAATGVYFWNSGRYKSVGGASANADQAASIQRGDDAALGLAALGTGLVVTGLYYLLTDY